MNWNDSRGNFNPSEGFLLKTVSLLLAVILWVTIFGLKTEEKKENVKFEPLLPPGMVLVNKIPSHIQFTVSGPRMALQTLEKKIQPIRPDLKRTRETTIGISVSEDFIGELPPQVRVVSFTPPTILIKLEEIIEKMVSVHPTWDGTPPDNYVISHFKVVPSKVAVSGPKTLVESLEAVGTELIDVKEIRGTKTITATVEVDTNQGLQLSRNRVVQINVTTKDPIKSVKPAKKEEAK